VGMTRHPVTGAVERPLALSVNFLTSRQLAMNTIRSVGESTSNRQTLRASSSTMATTWFKL
jgi:hypothetical protein